MTEHTVTLRIAGTSTGAVGSIDQVRSEVKALKGDLAGASQESKGNLSEMASGFAKVSIGAAAFGAAVATAFTALAVGTAKAVSAADQVDKLSEQFGLSSEAITGFGEAAALAGGSVEGFQKSLGDLSKAVTGAAGGQRQFEQLFADMGVAVTEAGGKLRNLETLLPEIADRFADYEDGPAKAALATKLFGAAGLELLPMLNQGAKGIAELREKAADLGLVLSEETTRDAAEFKDNLDRLAQAGRGFFNLVAADVLPILRDLSRIFLSSGEDAVKASKDTHVLSESLRFIAVSAIVAKNTLEILWDVAAGAIKAASAVVVGGYKAVREMTSGVIEVTAKLAGRDGKGAIEAWRGAAQRAAAAIVDSNKDVRGAYKDLSIRVSDDLEDMQNALKLGLTPAVEGATDAFRRGVPPVAEYGTALDNLNVKATRSAVAIEFMKRETDANRLAVQDAEIEWRKFTNGVDKAVRDRLGEKFSGSLSDGLDDFSETQRAVAQEFDETWGNLFDSVSGAFADFITGGIDSFKDFGRSLIEIARRFLADLVQRFLATRLTVGAGGIAGSGSAFASSGAASGAGGLGSLLGTGLTAAGSLVGGSFGLGLGVAGTAGIGSGFAFGAATLAQGNIMLGLGAMLPAVGIALAAIAGIYALLNKDKPPQIHTIGSNVVGTPGYRNLSQGSTYGSDLGGFTFASIDSFDRQQRDALAARVAEWDNAIAGLLDDDTLARARGMLANFNSQLRGEAITADNIIKERWSVILQALPEGMRETIEAAGDLEAQIRKLGEVMQFPAMLADQLAALEREDFLAGLDGIERDAFLVNEQFEQLRAVWIAMGATTEQLTRLEELRLRALARLTDGMEKFNEAIDATKFPKPGRPLLLDDDDINASGAVIDAFVDAELDMLTALRDAANGIRDFLAGYRLSELSTLTPLQKLQQAQADYNAMLARASAGDLDAIRGLSGSAQNLLGVGRSYFASGDEYSALERSVLAGLERFANVALDPNSTLQTGMQALATAFRDFATYLREFNERIAGPLVTPKLFAIGGAQEAQVVGKSVVAANDQRNPMSVRDDQMIERIAALERAVREVGGRVAEATVLAARQIEYSGLSRFASRT